MRTVARDVILLSLVVLGLAAGRAVACSCGHQSPRRAFDSAEVVFAGRVEDVSVVDSDNWEPRIVVRFKVGRVWKGPVSADFTMHTYYEASSCTGFFRELARPGEELLVFADASKGAQWKGRDEDPLRDIDNARSYTRRGGESGKILRPDLLDAVKDDATIYGTDICSGTAKWEDADFSVREYGAYRAPDGAYTMQDAPLFDESRLPAGFRKIASVCWELRAARDWEEQSAPPGLAPIYETLLDANQEYVATMGGKATTWTDVWWRNRRGDIGLCRMPSENPKHCGAIVALFEPMPREPGKWQITAMDTDPCGAP